jgi:ubiquinone/menaquinone biosynthesis C-methylase UbiE
VDGLLDAGYRSLTVLDIASSALQLSRRRLGDRSRGVRWIVADALELPLPAASFDLWHDRAVFHFLTDPSDRARYVAQARHAVRNGGHVIVASFGPQGPVRCSGFEVVRYAPETLHGEFGPGFRLLTSKAEAHHTPSGQTQAFLYCLCRVEADPKAATFGPAMTVAAEPK